MASVFGIVDGGALETLWAAGGRAAAELLVKGQQVVVLPKIIEELVVGVQKAATDVAKNNIQAVLQWVEEAKAA